MLSFKSIKDAVYNKLIASSSSPEEDVELFLEKFSDNLKNVSMYVVSTTVSRVVLPIKNKLLKSRIDKSEGMIQEFNDCLLEAAKDWAKISDKWLMPVRLEEALKKETTNFKNRISEIVKENQSAAKDLLKSLDYIQLSYELTNQEEGIINNISKKLTLISKISYEEIVDSFIKGIKTNR